MWGNHFDVFDSTLFLFIQKLKQRQKENKERRLVNERKGEVVQVVSNIRGYFMILIMCSF